MKHRVVRLYAKSAEKLEKLRPEPTAQAIDFVIEGYSHLRTYALAEIRGYFMKNELKLLIDAFNGTLIAPWMMSKAALLAQLEDAVELEGLDKKWEVDFRKLSNKIEHDISHSHSYFLIEEIAHFWNNSGDRSYNKDLDKFVDHFKSPVK